MTDVFISYKRRMRPQVEAIAGALRALGLEVWYDAALEAGVSFSAEISNEVRTAKCVLVCWTDDAFPHGGDRNGWVLGEATIGQDRGRLVPVLLEPVSLDPPWNTIHTESLIGWEPDAEDQSGWLGTLSAIGRQVGRPALADEAAALRSGIPLKPKRIGPTGPAIAVAALAQAALTAMGVALLSGFGATVVGGDATLYLGLTLCALPLALLFWRTRALAPWQAAALLVSFNVAAAAGYWLGLQAVRPIITDTTKVDLMEIIIGGVGGFVGAAVSLAAFPILGAAPRSRGTWLKVVGASALLAVVAALTASMPFFDIVLPKTANLWLAPIWQLAYAPLLVWVVRGR